jgi:hypothetical protein
MPSKASASPPTSTRDTNTNTTHASKPDTFDYFLVTFLRQISSTMAPVAPSAEEQIVFAPNETATTPPDLRFLHYNDVYHVDASSAEPVGGIARFQTLANYYRNDSRFKDQSKLLTFFSGDAFNPSLESSVTKGSLQA